MCLAKYVIHIYLSKVNHSGKCLSELDYKINLLGIADGFTLDSNGKLQVTTKSLQLNRCLRQYFDAIHHHYKLSAFVSENSFKYNLI